MSQTLPPRGSRDYYSRVFAAAEEPCLDDFTPHLRVLWEDYGWRSTVDVMTELICAIEFITPPAPKYRDFTGCVRLERYGSESLLNEEFMLEKAVLAASNTAERDGTEIHDEFGKAAEVTTRLLASIREWRPTLDSALRTAHSHKHRDPVRAVLAQGPGVRERDWWKLRDATAYLFQVALFPMNAARHLGRPLRPPVGEWLLRDERIPPYMALTLAPRGELSGDC